MRRTSRAVPGCDMSLFQPQENTILARLPISLQESIRAVGHLVKLAPGRSLHNFGKPTDSYFFPVTGVVSLTIPINGGQMVEVALVGREGIVGIGALLGDDRHDLEAMAQVRGEAVEVPVEYVDAELRDALRPLAAGYASSLMLEMAQTAACNRLHSVEQRTARWLLQAADRAQTNEIQLTHEFLAMMLAVRRASVTVVVGVFDRAGLIVAERGKLSLADRAGLTEVACECYAVIRELSPLSH
jgi:CRP-like cAMP-binding protein